MSPFYFYKRWPISVNLTRSIPSKFATTVIDLLTSPTYCCCTTLGKINLMLTSSSKTVHKHQMIIKLLLQRKTAKFIPADLRPQNVRDFNPVDYQMGAMQDHVYQMPAEDMAHPRQSLIDARCTASLTLLLMNGIRDLSGWNRKPVEHFNQSEKYLTCPE